MDAQKLDDIEEHINNVFNVTDVEEVAVPGLERGEADYLHRRLKGLYGNRFDFKLTATISTTQSIQDSYSLTVKRRE